MINVAKLFSSCFKFLHHPMVFASLALHGLVLMMPLFPSPASEAEPDSPAEQVELSSLTSLMKTPPKPSPQPIPKAVAPTPRPILPTPIAPRLSPPPTPIAAATTTPTPIATPTLTVTPTPVAEPTPLEPATPTPAVVDEFQDYMGQFQSSLTGLATGETAGFGIPCYLFPQPELFFTPDSLSACQSSGADPQPLAAIDNILWASRRRPSDVLSELQTKFAGFTFTPMTQFGGGELYQVQQGDTVRYINLVRSTDRTATFVVIWNQDPNLPGQPTSVGSATSPGT